MEGKLKAHRSRPWHGEVGTGLRVRNKENTNYGNRGNSRRNCETGIKVQTGINALHHDILDQAIGARFQSKVKWFLIGGEEDVLR